MLLKSIVDSSNQNSLAVKLRKKRFALFTALMSKVPRPLRILDVGGTEVFWKTMNFADQIDIDIILFNRKKFQVSHPNFISIAGDARDMKQFGDNEFDVVFSNSMIEQLAANEIKRVGVRYFVQTPNYHFTIEPHFLCPFFQYLSPGLKAFLLQHFNLGWYKKIKNPQEAIKTANAIRLLKKRELQQLFPGTEIYKEKILSLTKSFILYKGW